MRRYQAGDYLPHPRICSACLGIGAPQQIDFFCLAERLQWIDRCVQGRRIIAAGDCLCAMLPGLCNRARRTSGIELRGGRIQRSGSSGCGYSSPLIVSNLSASSMGAKYSLVATSRTEPASAS